MGWKCYKIGLWSSLYNINIIKFIELKKPQRFKKQRGREKGRDRERMNS